MNKHTARRGKILAIAALIAVAVVAAASTFASGSCQHMKDNYKINANGSFWSVHSKSMSTNAIRNFAKNCAGRNPSKEWNSKTLEMVNEGTSYKWPVYFYNFHQNKLHKKYWYL